MTPCISFVTLLARNYTFSTLLGNLTTVSDTPIKVLRPTPAFSIFPFRITKSHSLGWDSTQWCLRTTPKLAAATTSPERPHTYLGGAKNIEATKVPAAQIPPQTFPLTFSAIWYAIWKWFKNLRFDVFYNSEMKLGQNIFWTEI